MNINLALIYGSTREGRFCGTVAEWAAREIASSGGFSVDAIDPGALDLPHHHLLEDPPDVIALKQRLHKADAFVIVTPEYNHSYPAALKFVIDSASEPWQAKPVAFVSYGGVSGGLRAVEHLRNVFAELQAVTIRETVSFANARAHFDDAGRLQKPELVQRSMKALLESLRWWATALRDARASRPYGKAAA